MPNTKLVSTLRAVVLCGALSFATVPSLAQSLPVVTGKGSVTHALNTAVGAIFDIGSGVKMTFPIALAVGPSKVVTLEKATRKAKPSQVAEGFSLVGLPLEFSGALATRDAPIELAQTLKTDPRKSGQRAVLAMEIGTFCSEENPVKLKNGLCSGWELLDAEYDTQSKQLVAKLSSTGGLRLVFGTVPD